MVCSTVDEVLTSSKSQTAWCGYDVGKSEFEAALWLPLDRDEWRSMKEIPVKSFPRTRQGVKELLLWCDERLDDWRGAGQDVPELRMVMEATGRYSSELAAWMIEIRAGISPAIINPQTARDYTKSLALRNKTDKTDARALSRYGFERQPAAYQIPDADIAELRSLVRYRLKVIRMRVAEVNRKGEVGDCDTVRKMQARHIKQLNQRADKLESCMKQIVENNPKLQRDVALLNTICGVGFITAVTILAELGDLRRFRKARQLSAFAGLSPRRFESGSSVKKRTRLSKRGSMLARTALYMPAVSVCASDNEFADLYNKLVAQGKSKTSAHAAVMRKMLLVMRAILISGEPYQRFYRKRNPQPVDNLSQNPQKKA